MDRASLRHSLPAFLLLSSFALAAPASKTQKTITVSEGTDMQVTVSPDHKTISPYFQLLLSTTVENSVPGKSSLVALRIIP